MAVLKDGKTENLTIRVDPDFKEHAGGPAEIL
jgi:hypothetical protein